ncbi:hypothetical protein NW755_004091 [Fusarium falciforme]|uniref:Uncharacterized protein n=1 Tax=Fusarium falciforme TaxID=195108 RepID=A0A9W8R9F3_9HYPO|nr:hypothetical protein NW755_004091 [Fusarium falciforme]
MCLAKNTIWTCHRCGVNITDPEEPPVEFCFIALINEKCSRAFINVIVACDPVLCLYCGFHKQDMYYEVEKRV